MVDEESLYSKRRVVSGVNNETWRVFAGKCKSKGVLIGHELTKILDKYNMEN